MAGTVSLARLPASEPVPTVWEKCQAQTLWAAGGWPSSRTTPWQPWGKEEGVLGLRSRGSGPGHRGDSWGVGGYVAAVSTRCWQGLEKEHLLLTSPYLPPLYIPLRSFH